MIIIKLFDVILNIKDVNILFAINKNQQIFELVKQKYSNICYLESYIIQINKIKFKELRKIITRILKLKQCQLIMSWKK